MTALLETILNESNINLAIKNVMANKGASGIDNMKVEELPEYFALHGEEIKEAIRNRRYKPSPVREVYIPKPNGGKLELVEFFFVAVGLEFFSFSRFNRSISLFAISSSLIKSSINVSFSFSNHLFFFPNRFCRHSHPLIVVCKTCYNFLYQKVCALIPYFLFLVSIKEAYKISFYLFLLNICYLYHREL